MECGADDVLRVLADGWLYPTWVVGASRVRAVSDDWPQPGSLIAHSFGAWPLVIDDVSVSLAWFPDHGIELQARGWPAGEARVRIEVAPDGPGCLVRITEDAVRGPGSWVPRPVRSTALHVR
ncbi:SRPBCC family protein, partial [Cellulomonas rhizosphaerae]